MKRSNYKINLKTPIGNRPGSLEVITDGNQVWGTLSILNHTSPFKGKINLEKECTLTGSFITLIKTVFYTATGNITDTFVDLKLNDNKNSYFLTGQITNQEYLFT